MKLPEITRLSALEVFRNEYGTLYNDRVCGPDGTKGHYLRWEWANEGVVVIPFDGEAVALTNNFRYPVGGESLEFPRGSRKTGESIEAAAVRELQEEAGLSAVSTKLLGHIFSDTGLIANTIPVVLMNLKSRQQDKQSTEPMESIGATLEWLTSPEIDSYVTRARIQCGVTLAALLLLRSTGRLRSG